MELVNQLLAPLTCWVRRADSPPSTVRANIPTTMPKTVRNVRALRRHMFLRMTLAILAPFPFRLDDRSVKMFESPYSVSVTSG